MNHSVCLFKNLWYTVGCRHFLTFLIFPFDKGLFLLFQPFFYTRFPSHSQKQCLGKGKIFFFFSKEMKFDSMCDMYIFSNFRALVHSILQGEATKPKETKKNVFPPPPQKKSYLANQAEKEYFSDRYLAENWYNSLRDVWLRGNQNRLAIDFTFHSLRAITGRDVLYCAASYISDLFENHLYFTAFFFIAQDPNSISASLKLSKWVIRYFPVVGFFAPFFFDG